METYVSVKPMKGLSSSRYTTAIISKNTALHALVHDCWTVGLLHLWVYVHQDYSLSIF